MRIGREVRDLGNAFPRPETNAIGLDIRLVVPSNHAGEGMEGIMTDFTDKACKAATDEWDFFGRQTKDLSGATNHRGHQEFEDGWYQRVGDYWETGTHTHGIDGRDRDYPWSAAFISWVMRKAGAGDRFRYSTQHSVYISQAIRDLATQRAEASYWAYRLGDRKPRVGDIVCWGREAGVDYDHQKGGNYKGHSDLVVEVAADKIQIIGGNVDQSATKRPLALDGNGYLKPVVQGGENLFALMACRL